MKQILINKTTDQLNQLSGEIEFLQDTFGAKLGGMSEYLSKYIH